MANKTDMPDRPSRSSRRRKNNQELEEKLIDNPDYIAQCNATSRKGIRCQQDALRGLTVCRYHGGATLDAQLKAEERILVADIRRTYGLPLEVDPHDALLQEIHRTAGHVAWLGEVIADLEKESLTYGLESETESDNEEYGGSTEVYRAGINTWLQLYQRERQHLVKVCEVAIRAGVEERRVHLEEAKAQIVAQTIRAVVTDLGHNLADDNVRAIVRARLVEAGTLTEQVPT